MEQNTHTPGPWKVIGHQSVQDERGMGVAWCPVSVQFGQEPAEVLEPEAEANARLIASAPDLLKELMDLVKWADVASRDRDPGSILDLNIKAARAAIAKATGSDH